MSPPPGSHRIVALLVVAALSKRVSGVVPGYGAVTVLSSRDVGVAPMLVWFGPDRCFGF